MIIPTANHTERLPVACILSMVGGFLDVYTYLFRGGVFANAVTGNIVLLGLDIAEWPPERCGKYILAILFYAIGVFAAELIHKQISASGRLIWHQAVLLLEICCLLPIVFIPYGNFDFIVNSLIAFVCALQVQTFRRVHGAPFASTMCTGNLRSGTEALYHYTEQKKHADRTKAFHYYLVIICFVTGVAAGTVLLRNFGHLVFFLAPLGLLIVFLMITTKRQMATLRKIFHLS